MHITCISPAHYMYITLHVMYMYMHITCTLHVHVRAHHLHITCTCTYLTCTYSGVPQSAQHIAFLFHRSLAARVSTPTSGVCYHSNHCH